ncbi:unnamed protein product [Ambrosiozyma monospora]|uniref:Unnamed protein product n=1 Tax=Ambrosiozyma monospora TaxID=43982 RepID=A0ACB5UB01_AMBMO|nr:unnamed protein product [Ambrosiozyma monospora]
MARLELASIGLNEGNMEMAHSELTSTLTLPLPTKEVDLKEYTSIWCFLIMSFERLGDVNRALRICENIVSSYIKDDFRLSLLRATFLSIENLPSYNAEVAIVNLMKLLNNSNFNSYEINDQFVIFFLLSQNYLASGQLDQSFHYLELSYQKVSSEIFKSTICMLLMRLEGSIPPSQESYPFLEKVRAFAKQINTQPQIHQGPNSVATLTFRDLLNIASGQYTESHTNSSVNSINQIPQQQPPMAPQQPPSHTPSISNAPLPAPMRQTPVVHHHHHLLSLCLSEINTHNNKALHHHLLSTRLHNNVCLLLKCK